MQRQRKRLPRMHARSATQKTLTHPPLHFQWKPEKLLKHSFSRLDVDLDVDFNILSTPKSFRQLKGACFCLLFNSAN